MELPQNIKNIIDSLAFKENEWWITMSVEKSTSLENVATIIRSQLPTLLQERELHTGLKYQMRDVIEVLHNFIEESRNEHHHSDLLVLARFDETELSRVRKESVKDALELHVAPIMQVEETKVSVSNSPDLTLAKNHLALDSDKRMILTVSADEAKCYKGSNIHDDHCLFTTANPYIQPEHNRYYEQRGVRSDQSVMHGTGSEKVKRTHQSGLELFLKEQLQKVQSEYEFDTLTVFVSQQFAPLISTISKTLEDEVSNADTTMEVVSSDTFEDIELDAEFNSISSEVRPSNKVSGLHEVVEALRMHKVSKVFIPNDIEEIGYVTKEGQCYTYPFKDSKQVKSIRPWIFKLAHDSAADLAILGDASQEAQITAVLRY